MGKVDKRVRIIIDENLRWKLKEKAVKKKASMQSLVNEVLNKYVEGRLIEN